MAKHKRNIIEIDESKCNGCGQCVPSCKEGALQIINGKAKLVSEVYCDGLGACLGYCPTGALKVVEREADEFDENKVKKHMNASSTVNHQPSTGLLKCGCPGTMARSVNPGQNKIETSENISNQSSELRQWPIQLHLIPTNAPYLKDSSLVLMADCTAVAYPNIHRDFLKGRTLAIACPKLDDTGDYAEKLSNMIKQNNIKKIEVVMMEVPCCKGLMQIAENAVEMSGKGVVLKETVITLEGKKLT